MLITINKIVSLWKNKYLKKWNELIPFIMVIVFQV